MHALDLVHTSLLLTFDLVATLASDLSEVTLVLCVHDLRCDLYTLLDFGYGVSWFCKNWTNSCFFRCILCPNINETLLPVQHLPYWSHLLPNLPRLSQRKRPEWSRPGSKTMDIKIDQSNQTTLCPQILPVLDRFVLHLRDYNGSARIPQKSKLMVNYQTNFLWRFRLANFRSRNRLLHSPSYLRKSWIH